LADAARQLRGERHQERFFLGGVLALLALLRHQHAQHPATADDRHADKTVERRLAGGGDVAERGVRGRIFDIDRFGPTGGQPGQPLSEFQPHLANRARTQAVARHQHVFLTAVIAHINRANVGVNRGFDLGNGQVERFAQIAGRVDILNDAPQGIQHGTILK